MRVLLLSLIPKSNANLTGLLPTYYSAVDVLRLKLQVRFFSLKCIGSLKRPPFITYYASIWMHMVTRSSYPYRQQEWWSSIVKKDSIVSRWVDARRSHAHTTRGAFQILCSRSTHEPVEVTRIKTHVIKLQEKTQNGRQTSSGWYNFFLN